MNEQSKRKVGVLTFHDTLNYGALLQTYALNHFINAHGYDCRTVDYVCQAVKNREMPFAFIYSKSIKSMIKGLLSLKYKIDKKKAFDTFRDKYVRMTSKQYDQKTISDTGELFDTFVVGSDQIWNLKLTDNDFTYFVDFNNQIKKIAYAASFGVNNIDEKYYDEIGKVLGYFSAVSIREKSGCELYKKITGCDSEMVLDPVFLLSNKEWEAMENPFELPEKYVLVYFIHYNTKQTMELAQNIAEEIGGEVVYLNNTYQNYPGVINVRTASPEQFLFIIHNAEKVLTGSFHGLSFSLIFNKQVWFESPTNSSGTRLLNLADLAGIDNRTTVEFKTADELINYEEVNKRLLHYEQKSRDFLIKALDV